MTTKTNDNTGTAFLSPVFYLFACLVRDFLGLDRKYPEMTPSQLPEGSYVVTKVWRIDRPDGTCYYLITVRSNNSNPPNGFEPNWTFSSGKSPEIWVYYEDLESPSLVIPEPGTVFSVFSDQETGERCFGV
ncbi:MAG: hypothetical protein QG614_387 [Patescibacteria group bacterium]|nr:hypothetical protein [Patescibacteria group bacterium]